MFTANVAVGRTRNIRVDGGFIKGRLVLRGCRLKTAVSAGPSFGRAFHLAAERLSRLRAIPAKVSETKPDGRPQGRIFYQTSAPAAARFPDLRQGGQFFVNGQTHSCGRGNGKLCPWPPLVIRVSASDERSEQAQGRSKAPRQARAQRANLRRAKDETL